MTTIVPAETLEPARRQALANLVALARPRLAVLGLIMVVLSYVSARPPVFDAPAFVALAAGALLTLCGASALNQVIERDADAQMKRTMGRPLPAGRISPLAATAYGLGLTIAGLVILGVGVNGLTALSAAVGWLVYVAVYTPLKPVTTLATVVGAVPGAVPVLMGWAAARDSLDLHAWTLFTILFLWQLPHFLAIAWMYRTDYARAGFKVLSTEDPSGDAVSRQVLNYGLALLPASLLPSIVGLAGHLYFFGAIVLGVAYLACGVAMARERTGIAARRLLKASVYYLPLLFALLALDQWLG